MNSNINIESNQIIETVEGIQFVIEPSLNSFTILARKPKKGYNQIVLDFVTKTAPYKVLFYERYKTLEGAIKRKENYLFDLKKASIEKQMKEDFILNQSKNIKIEIGQIFYESWGYDQTNVDFYQVVKVHNSKVSLKALRQDKKETFSMMGTCTPLKDSFASNQIIEKKLMFYLDMNNEVKPYFKGGYKGAINLWDGKPKQWTGYA